MNRERFLKKTNNRLHFPGRSETRLFRITEAGHGLLIKDIFVRLEKALLISFMLLLAVASLKAQIKRDVSGRVSDSDGTNIPGVNVVVKGSTIGTVTDGAGNFHLNIPGDSATLVFSFVGMETQEVIARQTETNINVVMMTSNTNLSEIVITALGISREKKGLGYSVQEIQGNDMDEARESNFVNSLSGKIAGVQISTSGTVGSSSRIVIRGENSLNFGSNQPLYVVDGIPVGNSGTSNSTSADYGNSSAEFNPSDIESVNILKGPAASALYGSRAANGAVVITTKSGKNKKGLGVSVNSGLTFEKVLRLPKFQNDFGQGNKGQYEGSNFGASSSIYPDGIYDGYDESWGPRLNVGTLERQFSSPTTGGMRGGDVANPNRGDVIPTPWVSYNDNFKDFFEVGRTLYNNIALTGANENGTFRLSYTNLDQKGVVPNNDLKRNTFALKGSYNFTKKFSANASANYINTTSDNRPETGYGRRSIMYIMTWSARSMDMNSLRDYWQRGFEGIRQFQYNYGENHNNPFFLQYENTKGQDKQRFFGNINLNYNFNDKLSLTLRGGEDVYNDFRPMKWAVSTVTDEDGRYREENQFFEERNMDFLLRYNNNIGQFNYTVSGGGNYMKQITRNSSSEAPDLLIPGVYSLSNSASEITASSYHSEKAINSLYAFAQMDYKGMIYMDITGRNDWSSTLPTDNNSYFYPSVSLSAITNEMIDMPHWVSLAKIRLSVAQVGSDTNPYNLYNSFQFQQPWGSTYSLASGSSLKNNKLKPESITTYEIGTDLRFLNGRLGFDFTFYDARSKNQIIDIPIAASTSYESRTINAGEIQNKGFEIMLKATPVQITNGFNWEIALNYSKNVGKVIELAAGITSITQSAPGEDASIQARVGERMGAIYGPGYQRVENGDMKGEIIIFDNGRPKPTSDDIYLGNLNPDWIGSISNSFSYRNVSLSALVDLHWGGKFISHFYNKAMGAGQLLESAEGRAARTVGQEYNDPYYMRGAAALPNGSYVPNSTSTDGTFSEGVYGTDARGFHKYFLDHISEGQMFDATYMKLREVKIGFEFPNKIFKGRIKDVRLSLVGRNLFLWTPDSNQHFDPEASTATTGNGLVPGFEEMSLPSTKSYGINLSLNF